MGGTNSETRIFALARVAHRLVVLRLYPSGSNAGVTGEGDIHLAPLKG